VAERRLAPVASRAPRVTVGTLSRTGAAALHSYLLLQYPGRIYTKELHTKGLSVR
jgi:hypothetical protein